MGVIKECGGKMWMGERMSTDACFETSTRIVLIVTAQTELRKLGERVSRFLRVFQAVRRVRLNSANPGFKVSGISYHADGKRYQSF
jgi:hypothetical protein